MTQKTTQPDVALLVEAAITKRPENYRDCLSELRRRGWDIAGTPRDRDFAGTNSQASVSSPEGS